MPIQKCKPTSPGRRFVEKVVHDHLHKGAPYAPLVEAKKRTGGRNNNGHITTRQDRKSTRLNSSHMSESRMPSSA